MLFYYHGSYKLKAPKYQAQQWECTLKFDGLSVTVHAGGPRRALRKAKRKMKALIEVRDVVKDTKGLCESD